MADLKISVIADTKGIDRICIGGRLYDALEWNGETVNPYRIIGFDKETREITIKESDLLKLIQLVNPGQPDRPIRIIRE